MSHKYSVVLYSALATASIVSGTAENRGSVAISIRCLHPEVKSGSKVILFVTVTNASDDVVNAHEADHGYAGDTNNIEVRGASGTLLQRRPNTRTLNGKVMHFLYADSGPGLKPGGTQTNFAVLSDLFDLSKPGKYTVTIQNHWATFNPDSGWKQIDVKSNSITITILPKS